MNDSKIFWEIYLTKNDGQEGASIAECKEPEHVAEIVRMFTNLIARSPAELRVVRRVEIS